LLEAEGDAVLDVLAALGRRAGAAARAASTEIRAGAATGAEELFEYIAEVAPELTRIEILDADVRTRPPGGPPASAGLGPTVCLERIGPVRPARGSRANTGMAELIVVGPLRRVRPHII